MTICSPKAWNPLFWELGNPKELVPNGTSSFCVFHRIRIIALEIQQYMYFHWGKHTCHEIYHLDHCSLRSSMTLSTVISLASPTYFRCAAAAPTEILQHSVLILHPLPTDLPIFCQSPFHVLPLWVWMLQELTEENPAVSVLLWLAYWT